MCLEFNLESNNSSYEKVFLMWFNISRALYLHLGSAFIWRDITARHQLRVWIIGFIHLALISLFDVCQTLSNTGSDVENPFWIRFSVSLAAHRIATHFITVCFALHFWCHYSNDKTFSKSTQLFFALTLSLSPIPVVYPLLFSDHYSG